MNFPENPGGKTLLWVTHGHKDLLNLTSIPSSPSLTRKKQAFSGQTSPTCKGLQMALVTAGHAGNRLLHLMLLGETLILNSPGMGGAAVELCLPVQET